MSWLSDLDIFIFGLTLLQFLGERIEYTSRKLIAFRVINCIVIVTVLTFIVSNVTNPNPGEFVTSLENFTTVFHTFFKYLMFMYNKENLKKLMDAKTERFWKIPRANKNLSRKIRSIYEGINLIQIAMLSDIFPIIQIYVFTPYLNPTNPFIFASNVFVNSIVMDAVLLFFQYYFVAIIAFIVFGYDLVYLSLCTELRVQVKLLKCKLKEVFTKTNEDAVNEVWICVKYHNFLLRTHDRIQKMYSNVLLFHYFVSLITVCFDMYQSFVGEAKLSHEIQKFLALAAVIGEFAFYCVPAELLSSEFTDIAQALYLSKWYKNSPDIQKLMLPIMVKCQRPLYFSGAGFVDINVDAFGSMHISTSSSVILLTMVAFLSKPASSVGKIVAKCFKVMRKAFSFCAVIRNLLDK